MKTVFLAILMTIHFSGCAPQKLDNTEQTNENSAELISLEQQIAHLKAEMKTQQEEIAEQKEENEKAKVPHVSNDPDYNQMQKNLDELRSDLIRLVKQLDRKVDKRLDNLEAKYSSFKAKLDDLDNNYVNLSDFEALKLEIYTDLNRKASLLRDLKDSSVDPEDIAELQREIAEVQTIKQNITAEYQMYFKTALTAWNKKLVTYINKENSEQSKELKLLVKNEVERIKISIEAADNKIAAMDIEIDTLMQQNDGQEQPDLSSYNAEVENLRKIIKENKRLLANLKSQTSSANRSDLYTDIMDRQFAPCVDGGLKGKNFCFSIGSMITRLGGIFVDPTHMPNTIKGYIRYLTLSGITANAPFHHYNGYLKPSPSNMKHIKSCHGNSRDNLLPPQELWPRGVLLSLILQNIEKDINQQRKLKIISNNIKPVTGIAAWYRTKCYQAKISVPDGDHVYAASFDLTLADQKNKETFEFYRNYILENIWKNDTFNVVHPLK